MSSVRHARRAGFLPVWRLPITAIILVLDLALPTGRVVAVGSGYTRGRGLSAASAFHLAGRTRLNGSLLHGDW